MQARAASGFHDATSAPYREAMSDERPAPEEPTSDAAASDLAARGTPLSLAMGFETLSDRACGMRVGFRSDLVGDPAQGGLAGGVIFALLDQTCGMAIGIALRARFEAEGRALAMGGMATLDFRLDHVRPPRPRPAAGPMTTTRPIRSRWP